MAVGKNKRLAKGKKGGKKKIVDPFTKKDWYGVKGRVFECNQADLHNDETTYRKFKLICEDVQGKHCLTNFHGMSLTRDKLCSMMKKWQTMIDCSVDVVTTDGYKFR